jgi:dienelactone hydrolase
VTSIALFHSVLGVRPGVEAAAARLRDFGHEVLVIDQYGGRSFDDYASASAYQEEVGFPALMQAALDATAELPDGFVVAGFSNGAGMAEHVALHRPVAAALLFSGALPLPFLGAESWPAAVPVQLHYAVADPNRDQDWVDQFLAAVRASGAVAEFHEYAGAGHLFTDASRPDEFDAHATEALWDQVDDFLRKVTLAGRAPAARD